VDGPFFDLIQTAFSPNHPLKRARDFTGKVGHRVPLHICAKTQNGEPTMRVKVELMAAV
jgi:hypothetical protein